jgi:hypothetical protein
MWRRLLVLALCGPPMLSADVCDGLPAGPPKGSDLFGQNEPLSFKLSVTPGGTAFRITVRPLWQIKADRPIIDESRAGEIEVARCEDGKQLQVLPITAEQPIAFGSTFHADDLNFDGYLDFSVVTEFDGTTGDIRSYWVYDSSSGIFVQNEFTRELRCGSAAVVRVEHDNPFSHAPVSQYDGGECLLAAFIDFDPQKHEIGRRYFGGAMGGFPNTDQGKGERYRVVNNRLILIHKQDFEQIDQELCVVTVWDLVGETMRVTEVRRFDAQEHPVK